jgi:hypothetical protein
MLSLAPMQLEGELLLHCARARLSGGTAARVAELAHAALDWDLVLRLAIRHGTLPRLYRHLAATCPGVASPAAMAKIRAQYEYNSFRNLTQARELIRLLTALETAGIEALAYKGPTLAVHAYGDLAHRQFGDLDLLVRPHDAARAAALLAEQGYRGAPWPEGAAGAAYLARSHVHALRNANGSVEVELHWAFLPREFSFDMDLDRLWKRLERRALGGANVRALPPEELLVVLCAHGGRHLWARLKSACDVAALVACEKRLDWGRAFDEAHAAGARRMLALGLTLARDIAGAALPAEVGRRVHSEPDVRALAADVGARLFDTEMCQPASAAAQLFYLRARERWRDKARHGTRYLRRAYGEWRHGAPRRVVAVDRA